MPFKCDFKDCAETYESKHKLSNHHLSHTKGQFFFCEECGAKYKRLTRLEVHMRTHSGYKPFRCTFDNCKKSFNEKGNLITHLRVHTNEKPFVCDYINCGVRFKAHGHLKDHMKKHYDIKPYICPICDSRFSRNSTLKMHINTHVNTKPYTCSVETCKKSFVDKAQIKYHMKSHYDSLDNYEEIFNNYLTENEVEINKRLRKRKDEIANKTRNKKQLVPKLPKYIKRGNTYEIREIDEELNLNQNYTHTKDIFQYQQPSSAKYSDSKTSKERMKTLSFEQFCGMKRAKSSNSESRDNKMTDSSNLNS